jgi:predicted RNase H-like nuclease (RuvC/YqgF family)
VTIPAWAARIPRALAVLVGIDDSEKLTSTLTIQRDNLEVQLAACRKGREDEAKRHGRVTAEMTRQIEELHHEIEANTKPGDVLRRRLERVRGGGDGPGT